MDRVYLVAEIMQSMGKIVYLVNVRVHSIGRIHSVGEIKIYSVGRVKIYLVDRVKILPLSIFLLFIHLIHMLYFF